MLELTAEMEKTVERLEKRASSLVADKKLEAQLQSCIKQTRSGQSLKLKANMSKVRFWDADGNRMPLPQSVPCKPAVLRHRRKIADSLIGDLPTILLRDSPEVPQN